MKALELFFCLLRGRNGILFLLLLFLQSWVYGQKNLADHTDLNRRLILKFSTAKYRQFTPPIEFKEAFSLFEKSELTPYDSYRALIMEPDTTKSILHEYLRRQLDWGLPWLPLTWYRNDQHSEENFLEHAGLLEEKISRMSFEKDNDQLLLAYLLNSSVYHHLDAEAFALPVRQLAENLYRRERAFYDIRLEIHQEPSLATLTRLESFKRAYPKWSNEVFQIQVQLRYLFGQMGLRQWIDNRRAPASETALLSSVLSRFEAFKKISNPSLKEVDEMLESYETLSGLALSNSVAMRLPEARASRCVNNSNFSCRTQRLDYLAELNRAGFSVQQVFLETLRNSNSPISALQLQRFVNASLGFAISVGFFDSNLNELEKLRWKSSQSVSKAEIGSYLKAVELLLLKNSQRLRGIFASSLRLYSQWVPQADSFIDELVRDSSLLAIANLTASLSAYLDQDQGYGLHLRSQGVLFPARVLSPGISQGTLLVAGDDLLSSSDAKWDVNGIYFISKTPAHLQKVAGILTCDSGSVISHVNLLAANHGIPNIKVHCSLKNELKPLIGKQVTLAALQNGESWIQLSSQIAPHEDQVFKEFNKVKSMARVRLQTPTQLQVNYPLRLEQLRMTHSGRVAGGKACGQGELARVFPGRVPQGLVLPFGIYHDHIVKSGLKAWIQNLLSNPALRGDSASAVRNRMSALELIRKRIQEIELDVSLQAYLYQALSSPPFSGRGVFVRSDTNAEDLPGFVGAGLNETIPNVMGVTEVMEAIKKVWASPYSEKAFSWRNDLIENPWDVYPSVVIQIAIPSEVAGVMVVGDTQTEDKEDAVLLASNQGLGITTVNGEFFPEELWLKRGSKTLSQASRAYAATKKLLKGSGGIEEIPTSNPPRLFSDDLAWELAGIGDRIQKTLASDYVLNEKWDLEWGILGGRVILFQIRVFNGNKIAKNVAALRTLESKNSISSANTPLSASQANLFLGNL